MIKEELKSAGLEVKDSMESLFERGGTTIMEDDNYIRIKGHNIPLSEFRKYDWSDKPIYYAITEDLFVIIREDKMTYRKVKEVRDCGFTYSFMKTIVKTENLHWLKRHFKSAEDKDSPFYPNAYKVMQHQLEKEE